MIAIRVNAMASTSMHEVADLLRLQATGTPTLRVTSRLELGSATLYWHARQLPPNFSGLGAA